MPKLSPVHSQTTILKWETTSNMFNTQIKKCSELKLQNGRKLNYKMLRITRIKYLELTKRSTFQEKEMELEIMGGRNISDGRHARVTHHALMRDARDFPG